MKDHGVGGIGCRHYSGKESEMVTSPSVRRFQAILDQDFRLESELEDTFRRLGDVDGVELRLGLRNDSILPGSLILSPLVMTALLGSVEDGIVNVVQLEESLRAILQDPGLMRVHDKVENSTP